MSVLKLECLKTERGRSVSGRASKSTALELLLWYSSIFTFDRNVLFFMVEKYLCLYTSQSFSSLDNRVTIYIYHNSHNGGLHLRSHKKKGTNILREVVCLRGTSCTTKPGVECSHQVRTIFNISCWEAETLLQQLLGIRHGECGDDSQERLFQLHVERLVTGWKRWNIVFAHNQNRKPIFYQLLSNLETFKKRKSISFLMLHSTRQIQIQFSTQMYKQAFYMRFFKPTSIYCRLN